MDNKKDINRLILERIKKGDCSEEIKKFLNEILILELPHLGKPSWNYTKEYEKYIKNLSKDYKSSKEK